MSTFSDNNINNSNSKKMECASCLDVYNRHEMFTVKSCGHIFCMNCFKEYVCQKMKECTLEIKCPYCETILNMEIIHKEGIIDDDQLNDYKRKITEKRILMNGEFIVQNVIY